MRKLHISGRRLAARPAAGVARWTAWARGIVARLGRQSRQGSPVDMLWRRNPAPPLAGERLHERSVIRLAPVVNLHLNVRPMIRNNWRQRVAERASAPLSLLSHVERRTLLGRSEANRMERRAPERLILAPHEGARNQTAEREALRPTRAARRGGSASPGSSHPNVAHAFDRLLVRRERVTHEQTVERLLRRSRRVEVTATPPALALPKPPKPAPPSTETLAQRTTAERQRRETRMSAQPEALQAQWTAALDPNRLADRVLREMDRRLIARKERFGRV